jgi:integrase
LVRRALTAKELTTLIQTTERAGEWEGIDGKERALIYRLATETGLRRNEIRSLTKDSFDLESKVPTVTVAATYSKRRKTDTLPLRSELAANLRLHMATKFPGAPAFRLNRFSAAMLRQDMMSAGIKAETKEGVVDFHALRATFITNLVRGGVQPRQAQALARHSTIELTMQTYTRLNMTDHSEAIEMLPRIAAAG